MSTYATLHQFGVYGLPGRAVDDAAPLIIDHLAAASRVVDSYLPSRYQPPLSQWPESVTIATCRIAALTYLGFRGFDPESGSDVMVEKMHDTAMKWLRDVRDGKASLIGIEGTSAPVPGPRRPVRVDSEEPRGW